MGRPSWSSAGGRRHRISRTHGARGKSTVEGDNGVDEDEPAHAKEHAGHERDLSPLYLNLSSDHAFAPGHFLQVRTISNTIQRTVFRAL